MDARSVKLVQDSFKHVLPVGDKIAEIFYGELFAIDPSLRALFKGDMVAQRKKLISALALVVTALDTPKAILEPVKALARKHVSYGVEAAHYASVGNALLRSLEKRLGDEFTPELRQAWAEAYLMLASIMKEAAYGDTSAPSGTMRAAG